MAGLEVCRRGPERTVEGRRLPALPNSRRPYAQPLVVPQFEHL